MGGEAIANGADVADWDQVGAMVRQAIDTFGRLDTVVCNAGFLRDRMLANMSVDEWDADHARAHDAATSSRPATPSRTGATRQGRARRSTAASSTPVRAPGCMGSIGQGNYVAAKAGIAALTVQEAAEWGRYGVLANAIAPDARTRMTEGVFDDMAEPAAGEFDMKDPANASPLVVWLGSPQCDVTGRVFEIVGGRVNVLRRMAARPRRSTSAGATTSSEVGAAVHESIAKTLSPAPVYGA